MIHQLITFVIILLCTIFVFYDDLLPKKVVEYIDQHTWLYTVIGLGFTGFIVVQLLQGFMRLFTYR